MQKTFPSSNPRHPSADTETDEVMFDAIVRRALSRRTVLKSVVVMGGVATLGRSLFKPADAVNDAIAFDSIATDTRDDIVLPPGYHYQVVVRWGDPLWSDGVAFDDATRGDAASQAKALGDNVDGMAVFVVQGRVLLVVNSEYTNRGIIWGNRADGRFTNDDDVLKGMLAHGVNVVEIKQHAGQWTVVKDSPYNRRITPQTEIDITGPAAGNMLLQTEQEPSGMTTSGTWNNCGNGVTPWGTYLACEEDFNDYFSSSRPNLAIPPELQRYGLVARDRGFGWATIDPRFDLARHPNEPNRAGYIVEIDPAKPNSRPRKHTALGRFKHENAEVVVNRDGRVVVYMGDDERGEFLYRYVSNGAYEPGRVTDTLLTEGRLYAAVFHDDGSGEWRELNPANSGLGSQAEVCIHTRQAASAVNATTMDRPEWVAANPHVAEVYCALTNNKNRGLKPNAGGDPTPVGGPNPRAENRYGQIVRWRPDDGDHAAAGFAWDLYVLAGNPQVHADARAGSANIHRGNMFNSPDGIHFDRNGLLWIQTDGNYSNDGDFAGQGNNQMLVGDPVSGEIRRFMVGPRECEITGLAWSPDRRTLFVGIQHPGDQGGSHWPGGGTSVPRSAVIAIQRDDGAVIS